MSSSRESIFPSLKDFEWGDEFAKHDGVLDRVFLERGKPDKGPFIAYGVDMGDKVGYLQKETLSPGVSLEDVKAQALVNLRRELRRVQWRQMDCTDEVPSLLALILSDNYYAAEGLLLEDRMQEAHKLLTAETLLACTPIRGLLLAMAYDNADANAVEVFISVCYENYYSKQEETISPIVWALNGGKVRGYLDVANH